MFDLLKLNRAELKKYYLDSELLDLVMYSVKEINENTKLILEGGEIIAELKSLNELLAAAARILDIAASEIRDIPLEPADENISKIGQISSLIFELERQIYTIAPELEPDFLKQPSPFPPGTNRRFGEIIIRATELCHKYKYQDAIDLYESYISECPPDFFIDLAEGEIHRIKTEHSV